MRKTGRTVGWGEFEGEEATCQLGKHSFSSGPLLEPRKECDSPKPFSDLQGWAGGGWQNQASSLLPCPLPVPPHSPAHADMTNGWQHTRPWSLTILLSRGLPATADQSEQHQGTNHLSPGRDALITGPCLWFPAHVAGQCFY